MVRLISGSTLELGGGEGLAIRKVTLAQEDRTIHLPPRLESISIVLL